jgi:hypothetical protein
MEPEKIREISCSEALKLIAEYVDSQSAGHDLRTLEKHLESCKHCFDRVEFEKLLKARLKGLKLDVSSLNLSSKARKLLEDL